MKHSLSTFVLFIFFTNAFAQNSIPPLERNLSIKITNERLDNVLTTIGKTGNFSFSYNPGEIEINRNVSLNAQNQSVREILNDIFDNTATFKNKGNYIIIKKAEKEERKDFFVMGYVSDGETGLKIKEASIYEPTSLASTVSNKYGFYRLKLSRNLAVNNLLIRKKNYDNEAIQVKTKENKVLNIKLLSSKKITLLPSKEIIKQDSLPEKKLLDSISINPRIAIKKDTIIKKKLEKTLDKVKDGFITTQNKFTNWLVSTTQNIHKNNIKDTLYRTAQVSFLPYLGTNHYLSGQVINDFSLNMVGGYSLGINMFEVGGVFNLVRKNMNGFQVGGVLNAIGNNMNGFQTAGVINLVGKNVKGFQVAGVINMNAGNTKGFQVAGLANVASDTMSGIQIATFNFAKKISGLQIGFFNYANELNGIPIGFFSYVKKDGYRRLEINTDDLMQANITFKTGVKHFYNIFTGGYNSTDKLYSFGYGIGTSWKYSNVFSSNLDIVSSHIHKENDTNLDWNTNQLTKLSLGFECKLSKRIALFIAPTYNLFASKQNDIQISDKGKMNFTQKTQNYLGEKAMVSKWIGYQGGIRILSL